MVTKTDKDTEKYIGRICNNIKASAVKIADRINNLQESIYQPDWDRKLKYYKESDESYRKLAEIDFNIDGVKGQVFLEDFNKALNNLGKHIGVLVM